MDFITPLYSGDHLLQNYSRNNEKNQEYDSFGNTMKQAAILASEATGKGREDTVPKTLDLGIGFLFIHDVGMGLSAKLLPGTDSKSTLVQVTTARGESVTLDVDQIDPRNASAIEMFAFCQYADYMETGSQDPWGSWHALKNFATDADDVLQYDSFQEATESKRDWTKALMQHSNLGFKNTKTGEILDVSTVFQMLRDTLMERHALKTKNEDQSNQDWRTMDDDHWQVLLDYIDDYLDQLTEKLKEIREMQEDAATSTASRVPADMRSRAASMAMLAVLANGSAGKERLTIRSHVKNADLDQNAKK